METIYCIANLKTMECYVGRTYQQIGERWSQHIWGAWKGKAESKLAEALRHAPEDFDFCVLEQSTTASEATWMEQLKSEGWTLLNETGGNRKPPKKRDLDAERAWREANDAANRALAAKAWAARPEELSGEPTRKPVVPWNETPEYLAKTAALQEEWAAEQAMWDEKRRLARLGLS